LAHNILKGAQHQIAAQRRSSFAVSKNRVCLTHLCRRLGLHPTGKSLLSLTDTTISHACCQTIRLRKTSCTIWK